MTNPLRTPWSGWISALLLAFTGVAMLCTIGGGLGCFSLLGELAQCEAQLADGEYVAAPAFRWQYALWLGIAGGALLMTLASGAWKFSVCGEGGALSALGSFAGGFLVMAGIILAGESVGGEFLSVLQLSSGAWINLGAFLLSGVIVTLLFFRSGAKNKAAAPEPKAKPKGKVKGRAAK